MQDEILPDEKTNGGITMLIAILSLTYMMIIILIHAIWISSIIKHDGKCHYHDCSRLLPCQENGQVKVTVL